MGQQGSKGPSPAQLQLQRMADQRREAAKVRMGSLKRAPTPIIERPQRKACLEPHQLANNQINSNLTKSKSNLSAATATRKTSSFKSVQSANAKQKNATTNKVADRNASNNNQNRQQGPTSNGSAVIKGQHPHHQQQNLINGPTNLNNNHRPLNPNLHLQQQIQIDTREQEIQTDVLNASDVGALKEKQELWCKKADDTVQALALTVQYFTRQLDDLNEGKFRQDFEKMKTEWISARTELQDLMLRKESIEDALNQERTKHLQAIDDLRADLERSRTERSVLEHSAQESLRRVESLEACLTESEKQRKATLERLISEHELQLSQARAQTAAAPTAPPTPDQAALLAEVESLRTVLEIRSQEHAQLRSEVDLLRREMDEKEALRLKCEALEARCEDLKAQLMSKEDLERQLNHDNEVLNGMKHQLSKQNKRLSQRNEELLWMLRQKNEVVSVLTKQLTPSSQRLSKSLGPEHVDHPRNDSNCSAKSETQTCSMKYMVEKGDSVSWTLDITESMDSSNSCRSPNLSSSRRYQHETSSSSNGSLLSRQNSLRLSMPRRTILGPSGRARSNSTCESNVSRKMSTSAAEKSCLGTNEEEGNWSPSYQSTPLQSRRRNVTTEQSWSLPTAEASSTTTTTTTTKNCKKKIVPVDVSTTDEDDDEEEEAVGQRPQEAGGEAMISEETSTSSSSEDDELSSVSSGDIP